MFLITVLFINIGQQITFAFHCAEEELCQTSHRRSYGGLIEVRFYNKTHAFEYTQKHAKQLTKGGHLGKQFHSQYLKKGNSEFHF